MNPVAKYFIDRALIVAVALVAVLFFLHRAAPPPEPVHAPVAVFTAKPVENETQALIDAFKAGAESTASRVSPLQQPAVTVVRDTGLVHGLTDAQIAELLGALKRKTVEKVAVGTKVVGPSPAPTPSDVLFKSVYDAAYSADTHALHDTTVKTDVTISRQEVAPSRIGSMIASYGTGISFAFVRRGQYECDLGLLQPNAGTHLTGAGACVYNLPHTQLGVGPSVTYQHGVKYGMAAVVHF